MENRADEQSVLEALSAMQKNDTQSIQAAGNYLLQVMEQPINLEVFFSILSKSFPPFERQSCSLFCRRMIISFYTKFDPRVKENLKSSSLVLLERETNIGVRRGICGMISAIALLEFSNGEWKEVKEVILRDIQSNDSHIRENAMLLLFSLGTYASHTFSSDEMNSLFQRGLSDPNKEVYLMSLKAYCNIASYLVVEMNASILSPTTYSCALLLESCSKEHDIDSFLLLAHTFGDLLTGNCLSQEIVLGIVWICVNVFGNPEEPFVMRNAAKGYIIQVLDHNGTLVEKDKNISQLYQVVFNTLSEGAQEDASEEDDLPCILSEMILDAIGSNLSPQRVADTVIKEAQRRLQSSDWHDRRTALTSMLVIVEYTCDYFKPLLGKLLPTLRCFLRDPVPSVRRKAAFFFSECGYYCEEPFMEAASWIVTDIQEMLNSSQEFDVLSSLYILETVAPWIVSQNASIGITLIDMLAMIVANASQIKTKTMALLSILSVVEKLGKDSSERLPLLVQMTYSMVMSTLIPETVDLYGHALELLTTLLDIYGYDCLNEHLDTLVQHLCRLVGVDLSFDTFIFPFLLKVLVVGEHTASPRLQLFVSEFSSFIPLLEHSVYGYSEYVDADVPKADAEFGSLGNDLSVQSPEAYSLVTVDSGQAEHKASALDTLIAIYENQAKREQLEDEKKQRMMSCLVTLSQHTNLTIRHHAYKATIVLMRILYHEEQRDFGSIQEDGSTVRYSLILLRLYRQQLDADSDLEMVGDILHVLEMISTIVQKPFYEFAMKDLLMILSTLFEYNYPCQEDFINDTTLSPIPCSCPPVIQGLTLLEVILRSYNTISHLIPMNILQQFWSQMCRLLSLELDGHFVAAILHYCYVLMETTQEKAEYILPTLSTVLQQSIDVASEEVRAESCRCYGWCCQLFPTKIVSSLGFILQGILHAMQKREGDTGLVVDLATGAMNRILKNVIDAPKQELFIKVLDNLPPSKDATDAESIYKTIFDMYTNRGELFKQVAQPLIAALIRSLMKGSILSDELRQCIKECLTLMNQEDPQGFYAIVSGLGEEATNFMASILSFRVC